MSRQFFSGVLLVIGLILFVAVWSDDFYATRAAVMPMTIWGVGFLVSGAIMSSDKKEESSDSEK